MAADSDIIPTSKTEHWFIPKDLNFKPPTGKFLGTAVDLRDLYKLVRAIYIGSDGAIIEVIDRQTKERCVVKLIIDEVNIAYDDFVCPRLINSSYCIQIQRIDQVIFDLQAWLGIDDDLGKYFLALRMPYYSRSLLQHNKSRTNKIGTNNISYPKFKYIIYSMVMGIIDTHKHNVVHGDIKLENWMVTTDNTAILIDYGLAQLNVCNTSKRSNTAFTVNYRPPEVLLGNVPNFGSDVWALGISLTHLYLNQLLFVHIADSDDDIQSLDSDELDNQYIKNVLNNITAELGNMVKSWPGVVDMPDYKKYKSIINQEATRSLSDLFEDVNKRDRNLENLILQLLQINPNSRPNIYQVIQHAYFDEVKLPKPPALSCTDSTYLAFGGRKKSVSLPELDYDLYPKLFRTVRALSLRREVYFLAADYLRRLYHTEYYDKKYCLHTLGAACILIASGITEGGGVYGRYIDGDAEQKLTNMTSLITNVGRTQHGAWDYTSITGVDNVLQAEQFIIGLRSTTKYTIITNSNGNLGYSTIYDCFESHMQEKKILPEDLELGRALLVGLTYCNNDVSMDPKDLIAAIDWILMVNRYEIEIDSEYKLELRSWLNKLIHTFDVMSQTKYVDAYFQQYQLSYMGRKITTFHQLGQVLRQSNIFF